jgi:DNA-binding transcriptional LysR family regulator
MEWSQRIGRRIKLRDLHILLAVAQCKSIAKAADHLAISQPVVSKVIADLEHTIGVRLVDRDRHGAEPTVYGIALLKRGIAAFDELRQGVKDIEFLAGSTAGELRIGGDQPMAAGLIPAIVDRLARKYPRLTFDVTPLFAATLFRELRERGVDLVVGALHRPVAEDDLNVEILYNDPMCVVAGVQNRWARRRSIALAELVDEPWTLPRPDTPPGTLMREIFHAAGMPVPRAVVISNSIQIHHTLLATGRYLTMFSRSAVLLGGKRSSIKPLPVNLPIRPTPIGIVTLKNRTLNPIAKLFIDHAREIVKPLVE